LNVQLEITKKCLLLLHVPWNICLHNFFLENFLSTFFWPWILYLVSNKLVFGRIMLQCNEQLCEPVVPNQTPKGTYARSGERGRP
jgi:hypothetical protein